MIRSRFLKLPFETPWNGFKISTITSYRRLRCGREKRYHTPKPSQHTLYRLVFSSHIHSCTRFAPELQRKHSEPFNQTSFLLGVEILSPLLAVSSSSLSYEVDEYEWMNDCGTNLPPCSTRGRRRTYRVRGIDTARVEDRKLDEINTATASSGFSFIS